VTALSSTEVAVISVGAATGHEYGPLLFVAFFGAIGTGIARTT
jgi:hypothetical protein